MFAWNHRPVVSPASLLAAVFLLASLQIRADSLSAASASGEPLGPSTRRTGLVVSEIMYRPLFSEAGTNLRFVEIYNSQLWYEDISGYRLAGAVDFVFPPGTVLQAESFLVVAGNPEDLQAAYGITNVTGPYAHSFKGDSGTVRLENRAGAILWQTTFSTNPPWPVSADGQGHSLVLRRPSYGEASSRAWAQSAEIGGSPGRAEPGEIDPLRAIMINELMAQEDGAKDFIELYNHSAQSQDLSGCVLTGDSSGHQFVIPDGAAIPPGGFLAFTANGLGFSLSRRGGIITLKNRLQNRILDAVRYPPQAAGASSGRTPDGADFFRSLAEPTPGRGNSARHQAEVVINEIMHSPISHSPDDEYIELYNQGTNSLSLENWRFTSGVKLQFPSGASIDPDGFFVVARRAARLLSNYPSLNPAKIAGDFSGTLSAQGEEIILSRPEVVISPGAAGTTTSNVLYVVEDAATYGPGGQWGKWADGGGSSLERINPRASGDLAANWAVSDETAKSSWTTIGATGVVDLASSTYAADSLQIFLMGEGECLIDDVEVFTAGGTNRVSNGNFSNGLTGWTPQGSQIQSSLEPSGGVDGSPALHLRSTHRGDTGANRIRTRLTAAVPRNATVTIRAKARWLCGFPEVLLRLRGNGMEAPGQLEVPPALGTPGERNSRWRREPPPAIDSVTHSPATPLANQPARVTVRIDAPDGLTAVHLHYRIDPSTNDVSVPMNDAGLAGDELANDAIYSALIPGQGQGVVAAFYIEARGGNPELLSTFPQSAPARECLVRFGDPQTTSHFGTYRLWLTQGTVNSWSSRNRLKLSNEPLDGTFVYGDSRVIYNIGAYFSGSPYHSPSYNSPTGAACNYSFIFPRDDAFLGATDFKLTAPGNNPGDDDTAQREQTSYWMASQLGLPYNYQRNINLYVNGAHRGSIFEDSQIPDSDVLAEWFPQADGGDLYKIAGWFEFDDGTANFETTWATLQRFLSGGKKKLARYRWNFQKRASELTTSNYTNLFELVDAVTGASGEKYQAQVEALVDVEEWMRIFALEHIVGNWDSYGDSNGQNMFAYKPPGERWKLLIWDLDIVLGLRSYSDTATSDLFKVADGTIKTMYDFPAFRRAYWRAVEDAVNGPLLSERVNPLLDAKYKAFTKNAGTGVTAPTGIKSFISTRRNYLLSQLKTVAANFEVTSRQAQDFSTDQPFETITGTAPVDLKTLKVNGVEYPIKWASVTNWSVRVSLHAGRNVLRLQGFDTRGSALPALSDTLNISVSDPPGGRNNHILLNEWMAGNTSVLRDPADGEFKDWLELYNPSINVVDLSGFSLGDGNGGLERLVFPNGSKIDGHDYLLVWADNLPGLNGPDGPLHAPFKLKQAGDAISLFAPDGTVVDSISFGAQEDDVSEGRRPDNLDLIEVMALPTPGEENQPREANLDLAQIPLAVSLVGHGAITLAWKTEPGKTYHLQFKNDLSETSWHNLAGDVVAADLLAARTNAILAQQRFYRVQRVD